MDIVTFVKYFDLIKPTYEEVVISTSKISHDIADEIYQDYDLKITSMDFHEDVIVDLIENTNISQTGFSPLHFYKNASTATCFKIGMIEEKGELFFDESTKDITFIDNWVEPSIFSKNKINQIDFLAVFLKYLELDFNRVYRKNAPDLKVTIEIPFNIEKVRQFEVFEILFAEREYSIENL